MIPRVTIIYPESHEMPPSRPWWEGVTQRDLFPKMKADLDKRGNRLLWAASTIDGMKPKRRKK